MNKKAIVNIVSIMMMDIHDIRYCKDGQCESLEELEKRIGSLFSELNLTDEYIKEFMNIYSAYLNSRESEIINTDECIQKFKQFKDNLLLALLNVISEDNELISEEKLSELTDVTTSLVDVDVDYVNAMYNIRQLNAVDVTKKRAVDKTIEVIREITGDISFTVDYKYLLWYLNSLRVKSSRIDMFIKENFTIMVFAQKIHDVLNMFNTLYTTDVENIDTIVNAFRNEISTTINNEPLFASKINNIKNIEKTSIVDMVESDTVHTEDDLVAIYDSIINEIETILAKNLDLYKDSLSKDKDSFKRISLDFETVKKIYNEHKDSNSHKSRTIIDSILLVVAAYGITIKDVMSYIEYRMLITKEAESLIVSTNDVMHNINDKVNIKMKDE